MILGYSKVFWDNQDDTYLMRIASDFNHNLGRISNTILGKETSAIPKEMLMSSLIVQCDDSHQYQTFKSTLIAEIGKCREEEQTIRKKN